MLKKLAASLNPFFAKRADKAAVTAEAANIGGPTHEHSFLCPCKPCNDHTAALTRARLKRQGA
jgi:hypothetical protein